MSIKPSKRAAVLERADDRCELSLPVCTLAATTVHHLVKVEWGGRNTLGNLRAACPECHAWVHENEAAALTAGLLMLDEPETPPARPARAKPITPKRTINGRCMADHPLWQFMRCVKPGGHTGQHQGIKGVHGGQVNMWWGDPHAGLPDGTPMARAGRGVLELARHPFALKASHA